MGSVGNMESVNSPNLEHGRNPTFDLPDRNWERLRRSPLSLCGPRLSRSPGGRSRPSAGLGSLLHSGSFCSRLAEMGPVCGQPDCSTGGADGLLLGWGASGLARDNPVCPLN